MDEAIVAHNHDLGLWSKAMVGLHKSALTEVWKTEKDFRAKLIDESIC